MANEETTLMVTTPNKMAHEPLKLMFLGSLVEQLGAQLYPSATATVAELISNAWDADAHNVWVSISLGKSWDSHSKIEVIDDGHGMDREQAQAQYLMTGRKRRLEDHGKTPEGRLVHGRKGIGKLAAFGTAKILDCYTIRKDHSEAVSFRLDYDKIRNAPPGSDYRVEENVDQDTLTDPYGNILEYGTRIKLTHLRLKRAISAERFMRSMSRRFSIDQTEMQVFVNGEPLQRFNMELASRFPANSAPVGTYVDTDGWGVENLKSGRQVRWWIGFTPEPIKEEFLRGISISSRGKMLQRPFMFERAGGTSAQIGQEYLVGEVEAEWLDVGEDIEDDLVLTNRDQLQLEDERIQEILEWGRNRIRWALRQRQTKRKEDIKQHIDNSSELQDLFEDFTETEQQMFRNIANMVSEVGDASPQDVHDLMVEVINGYDYKAVRELMERVKVEDEAFQGTFWNLVREFSLIDARKNLSIIQARLNTIDRVDAAIEAGATEVPEIHKYIKDAPWLLDPRWSLLGDEVDPKSLNAEYEPTYDEETRERLDFLFILQPKDPASADEILVVEIKRGKKKDGTTHRVTHNEVNKFHLYVLNVKENYTSANTQTPRVSGLMIANAYTTAANRIRSSLEGTPEVNLEFQTWKRVIERTRKLHMSWLEVTRKTTSS